MTSIHTLLADGDSTLDGYESNTQVRKELLSHFLFLSFHVFTSRIEQQLIILMRCATLLHCG